jgi:hypothetical protein
MALSTIGIEVQDCCLTDNVLQMKKILISISIGAVAGLIDILPMIAQHLSWNANLSAFLHWVSLGVIIAYIDFGINGWMKGLIIAEATAIPFVLISGVGTVLPILSMSAVLGILVGLVLDKLLKA